MSRKRSIPGVDAASLAALAEQFPSGAARPRETRPEAVNEVLPFKPAAPPPPGPARIKAPGRGLAIGAMLLAVVAVLVSTAAIVPVETRSLLTKVPGMTGAATPASNNIAAADPRLAAAVQSIGALESKTAAVTTRLAALEATVGRGDALQRIAALEASLKDANDRLAAGTTDADRTVAAPADIVDARFAAFDGDLKRLQDGLAATEKNVNDMLAARLGVIEADIGVLQNTDRRPEKFFLTALQLRDVTRTSGPFTREAAAARSLAGGNADLLAALDVLSANAQDGVATVAELRDNFSAILVPRLNAVAAANRQPITERALGWVGSLFATAAAPTTAADRNGALIALAERSLEQDQLAAATHQLLLLEDEAALVAAEWLKNASARLAVDKAMASVMSQALDHLAASP